MADSRIESDERASEVLVEPPVDGVPGIARIARHSSEFAADKGDLLDRGTNYSRARFKMFARKSVLPNARRLHHVIVDRDDLGELRHRGMVPRSLLRWFSCPGPERGQPRVL